MYYYIFDIKQCKNKAQAERIKDYLSELGIGGEYVFPSQARTAKELVNDALGRNFSTIVAIGSDNIISEVAQELVGGKAAFGILPINASDSINDLISGRDWRQAAKNLRFRKIKECFLGCFENGHHFLTSTELSINSPINLTLEFDDFIAQSRTSKITVSNLSGEPSDQDPVLKIEMVSENQAEGNIIGKIFRYLDSASKNPELKKSLFFCHRLRIFSQKKANFIINNQAVAATPQLITISRKKLRLIVNREVASGS
jgi:hypothetical protein